MTNTDTWTGTYSTSDSGWEIRTVPYRNPRTGITSPDEVTITAIHRGHGWVLRIERATPQRAATLDPGAVWANGCER